MFADFHRLVVNDQSVSYVEWFANNAGVHFVVEKSADLDYVSSFMVSLPKDFEELIRGGGVHGIDWGQNGF